MTLLLVGLVAWVLLVVFVCSLGRAAKAGDRLDLERVRGWAGLVAGCEVTPPAAAVPVRRREESAHRELLDARRARSRAPIALSRYCCTTVWGSRSNGVRRLRRRAASFAGRGRRTVRILALQEPGSGKTARRGTRGASSRPPRNGAKASTRIGISQENVVPATSTSALRGLRTTAASPKINPRSRTGTVKAPSAAVEQQSIAGEQVLYQSGSTLWKGHLPRLEDPR